MISYPGDLTPEQRNEWETILKGAAERRWGVERASAIEDKLRQTAIAIGRLDSINFTYSDIPAFFLNDSGQDQASDQANG